MSTVTPPQSLQQFRLSLASFIDLTGPPFCQRRSILETDTSNRMLRMSWQLAPPSSSISTITLDTGMNLDLNTDPRRRTLAVLW